MKVAIKWKRGDGFLLSLMNIGDIFVAFVESGRTPFIYTKVKILLIGESD